jgi:hypothetical protein
MQHDEPHEMLNQAPWTYNYSLILCLTFLGTAMMVAFPNRAEAVNWNFETVDSAGDVGGFASLAIGSDNRPRIAYEDVANYDLKYAQFDGNGWLCETVHATPDIVGQYTQLCLDSLNNPHIAYEYFNKSYILYAHHDGVSWNLETANTKSYSQFSIRVDSLNQPIISSLNVWTYDLNVAKRTNGSWSVESPDTAGATGYHTSLAIDASDHPWISYIDSTNHLLKLAHYTGTAWQFQTVASGLNYGGDTSLALDSKGLPHISYSVGENQALKYAVYDGTAWHTTIVDANSGYQNANSLALDANDRPRIVYTQSSTVRFASFDGINWATELLANQAGTPSLAIAENGTALVAYYNGTTGDLMLATQVPEPGMLALLLAAGIVSLVYCCNRG